MNEDELREYMHGPTTIDIVIAFFGILWNILVIAFIVVIYIPYLLITRRRRG